MGDTLTRIREAIAAYHMRTGQQPRHVVVSVKEDLPALISGATIVPSKDLNPGDFRINDEPNYSAYWAALLKRHKALIAAGCISPVGCLRVGGGAKKEEETPDDNA